MSVLLGMASKDERGWYSGGVPGDQTGKEVYIRTWYDRKPWDTYILFKSPVIREKFAHALEVICNCQKIGYSQSQRLDLYSECEAIGWNLSRINEIHPCSCDCSSLMAVCARFAGVIVNRSIWTGNLAKAFQDTGTVDVFKDKKYLKSDRYIQRGGMLLNTWHHVAGVLSTGDGVTSSDKPVSVENNSILRVGSKGNEVVQMQNMLIDVGYPCGSCGADGVFGTDTFVALCAFQKMAGLAVDGEYGPKSKAALETAYNSIKGRKSVDTIAREVVSGKWGNGAERVERLEKAGYDATQIQRRVDEIMGH